MNCFEIYLLFLIFSIFLQSIDKEEVCVPGLNIFDRKGDFFFLHVKNTNTSFVVSSCVVLY